MLVYSPIAFCPDTRCACAWHPVLPAGSCSGMYLVWAGWLLGWSRFCPVVCPVSSWRRLLRRASRQQPGTAERCADCPWTALAGTGSHTDLSVDTWMSRVCSQSLSTTDRIAVLGRYARRILSVCPIMAKERKRKERAGRLYMRKLTIEQKRHRDTTSETVTHHFSVVLTPSPSTTPSSPVRVQRSKKTPAAIDKVTNCVRVLAL